MNVLKLTLIIIIASLISSPAYAVILFHLDGNKVPNNYKSKQAKSGEDYLTIQVKSMQINRTTIGFNKYYASVQGNFKFDSIFEGKLVEFETVTKPSKLLELDKKHQDRIVQFNQDLLGPIPYAGGKLHLEIGLISVKSIDLSEPYLKLLGSIGSTAGVSLINNAMPFIPLIKEGVDVLTNTGGNSQLQAAYDSKWDIINTGYYVLVRDINKKEWEDDVEISNSSDFVKNSKSEFDYKSFKIIEDTNIPGDLILADKNDKKIEGVSYVIIFVDAKNIRDDWYKIPEINKAYKETFDLLFSKKVEDAEKQLVILNDKIRQSWDLQLNHKKNLINSIKNEFDNTKRDLDIKAAKPARKLKPLESHVIFN